MRIAVTSNGADLDAPASPVFGRCPWYLFVEPDSMEVEAVENPAMGAAGGAGIQAAQFVVEQEVEAVVTGNMGPNAFEVFRSAGVPVYLLDEGTVRDAVEAYRKGELSEVGGATGPAHAGLGRGGGMGPGATGGRRTSDPASGRGVGGGGGGGRSLPHATHHNARDGLHRVAWPGDR
ncbi:MAG: NifB/NifX family molybdenum-iron cluster-binding protein [Chloroflexota bacterium]|nr:NifB/NifX family molybdenum-iron cluster-binding protein [Chloroflexota bacterium]